MYLSDPPPEYEAPSALAHSPRFSSWAIAANIHAALDPSPASMLMFNQLCEFKLPKSFLAPSHAARLRSASDFYSSLHAWATSHPTLLVDDDIHCISEHFQMLSLAYFSISDSFQKKSKEAVKRLGVDLITKLAFDSEDNSIHDVFMEPDLRLPVNSHPTIRVGPNTIADTLVVLPFPQGLTDKIYRATQHIAAQSKFESLHPNAFWSKDTTRQNSLIVFASEYKRDDGIRNKNQLAMDFGAAQSQRRALGLDHGIIWGATCAEGCFEVFSSQWVDENIAYAPYHKWNLLDPVDFMKCYSFLCNLAGTTATLQQQLAGVDVNSVAQSILSFSWRAITPSTRRRSTVQGANSEGVDDLEPDESNQWRESMDKWQRERLDVPPAKVGLPLTRDFVNRVFYDGEHTKSVVDEWSAHIGNYDSDISLSM